MLSMGLPIPDGTIVLNRYRIQRVLGQGGFGRTYLAHDTNRFNEACVLKEFDPQTQGAKLAQKAEELFEREASVLYRLQHPQIPQFRELFKMQFQNRELVFLVQDYVSGKTYEELLIDRHKFTESEAVGLLQQLLPVLDYIHRSGIVHRDISPDNIIQRDLDQKAVLIDFGVVKAAATQLQSVSSQTFVGKPGYAPIEQIRKGSADPSSDLYALAVTIAVLLTGREAQSLFNPKTLTCEWKQYASVSPALAQILDRMMSNRPGDRYGSARDVLNAMSMMPASVVPVRPQSVPTVTTHSTTLAVGRRPRSIVATATGNYPRSWFDTMFDFPLAIINGTYRVIKKIFKLMFGLVRLTVVGTVKLAIKVALGLAAVASLFWLIPQVLPYIAKSVPDVRKVIPRPSPSTVQARNYESECQKLGIDYAEFIAQVNTEFYRRYPERGNKPLSQDPSDKPLRDEWHRIAQEILSQRAKLSL